MVRDGEYRIRPLVEKQLSYLLWWLDIVTPPTLEIHVPVKAMVNDTVEYEIPLFIIIAIKMGRRRVRSRQCCDYNLLATS